MEVYHLQLMEKFTRDPIVFVDELFTSRRKAAAEASRFMHTYLARQVSVRDILRSETDHFDGYRVVITPRQVH